MILYGRAVQEALENKIKKDMQKVEKLKFVIIYIGEDLASEKYIQNKIKFAQKFNIKYELIKVSDTVKQQEVEELIVKFNNDIEVHGIFLQLPIPKHLNEFELTQKICWEKDIDGFNIANIGYNYYNHGNLVSCTAKGIISMLEFYDIEMDGKTVCIAGRSNIVGKMLAIMFINKGATTIVCNSKTKNIKKYINESDIFVSAIGKGHFFTENYFENNKLTVIDVGINFQNKKLIGDVDFENVKNKVRNISPVPGGVGLLTVSQVILNLIKAYEIQKKKSLGEKMEKIMAFAKREGFVYQGSELYGGLANSWDYGPQGVELKNNLKNLWWKFFISQDSSMIGIDSAIIMNPKVWEGSGHVGNFSDPLVDCKNCNSRFRADKLIEEYDNNINAEVLSYEEMSKFLNDHNIVCPNCKKLDYTKIRSFNLMLSTSLGVVDESASKTYLRPETAQGIFINFKNIMQTTTMKVPFGIGQIGKSFRNEITPGNFIFRTREFEQMEIEYFTKPEDEDIYFEKYQSKIVEFLKLINLKEENYRLREHDKEELAHYSSKTIDVEYKFPFGFGELWGLAARGNYDLKSHEDYSKVDLKYVDPQTNEKFLPHVIEPSVGVDRLLLAILLDAYEIEDLADGTQREVLKISKYLAPFEIAILPLVKKQNDLAQSMFDNLSKKFKCSIDISGKIGKRYRRQDAIGTPYCLTVDYDSVEKNTVTIRDRDTMEQEVVEIDNLDTYLFNKLS